MLSEGLISSSSGRGGIFLEAFYFVSQNALLPYNVGYYQLNNQYEAPYPHNFFIDLLLVTGLPGLILFLGFYFYFILLVYKINSKPIKYFIFTLCIYSMLRLSVSGTFWTETLFWLPFFVYFSFKNTIEPKRL
jgi:O-antigen ligase